jgi:nuclease-like protein
MALDAFATAENRVIAAVAAAAAGLGTAYFVWRAIRRRRSRAELHESILSIAFDHAQDVLVPDGMGGFMHIDYLLLTSRGVLVVDLRDIPGNIFGGDQMTEWTAMEGARRQTFPNPQGALYDRVAAVRSLAGDLTVEGRILFTRRGRFPKGLPRWTLMVDSLRTEFPPPDSHAFESWLARYRENWETLRTQLTASPLRRSHSLLAEIFFE